MIVKTDPMFERVLRLKFAHEEYTKGMAKEFEEALKELYKKFLEKHMEVHSIRFDFYIPSFNDGEACLPTLGSLNVLLWDEIAKDEEEQEWIDIYSLDDDEKYRILIEDIEKFEEILGSVEFLLKSIYGINVRIVINRSKIEVEEYDCGY